jgi:HAD superfamily hydrolase (TIGR01509 family)
MTDRAQVAFTRLPTEPLEAVIFDMDGTLLDTSDVVATAYSSLVAEITGHRLTPEEVVALYRFGPPGRMLAQSLGRPAHPEEIGRYHAYVSRLASRTRPYRGIRRALADLALRLPLAVFTGAATRGAEILLRHSELLPLFRAVLGSDGVSDPKPAPEGLVALCARLGVDRRRTAYVGDAEVDVLAARAAGCIAVGAAWGHQWNPRWRADVVLDRPSQLALLVGDGRSLERTPAPGDDF